MANPIRINGTGIHDRNLIDPVSENYHSFYERVYIASMVEVIKVLTVFVARRRCPQKRQSSNTACDFLILSNCDQVFTKL